MVFKLPGRNTLVSTSWLLFDCSGVLNWTPPRGLFLAKVFSKLSLTSNPYTWSLREPLLTWGHSVNFTLLRPKMITYISEWRSFFPCVGICTVYIYIYLKKSLQVNCSVTVKVVRLVIVAIDLITPKNIFHYLFSILSTAHDHLQVRSWDSDGMLYWIT